MINPPFSPDQGQKSIYIAIPKQPYKSTTFVNVNTLITIKNTTKTGPNILSIVLYLDACSIFHGLLEIRKHLQI